MRQPLISFSALSTLFSIFAVLVFFSNAPTYLYNVRGGVPPLVFYAAVFVLAFLTLCWRPRLLGVISKEPLFYWFLFFALSGVIWIAFLQDYVPSESRAWRLRILLFSLFSSGLILFRAARLELVVLALWCCLFVAFFTYWHDFLNPFHYVPSDVPGANPGRGAGFFVNANQAGNALVLMAILIMPFADRKYRPLLVLLMVIGVFPTFSRSSIILALISIVLWVAFRQLRSSALFLFIVILPVGLYFGYEAFRVGVASSQINYENVVGRLQFFTDFGATSDFSAVERKHLVRLGWEMFSLNPIVGIGVGETHRGTTGAWGYPTSTHNMYMLFAVEQGLVGVLVYFCFLVLLARRGLQVLRDARNDFETDLGFAVILLVFYFIFLGFFSHTLLEEPYSVLALAFLLAGVRRAQSDT